MGKYKVEILLAAWQDIDRISDVYLRLAGAASAKKITDALLDTLARLGDFPYMGAQHPDPELARREFRKVLCGDLVCVYTRPAEEDLCGAGCLVTALWPAYQALLLHGPEWHLHRCPGRPGFRR